MIRGLREWVAEYNEDALFVDDCDEAIVGIAERCSKPALIVYDIDKCIESLAVKFGMNREMAEEYFSFNVLGAWAGEHTPLFLHRPPGPED